ncbi:MAG: sigma-70 family RNA polymerase sigma factor [bacterium]|nr:sigma-70 family RNA polymerase sigma factor [bacterium]
MNAIAMRPIAPEPTPNALGDEALMTRYAQGDAQAFDTLFERHRGSVYAFIQGFTPHRDQWDDLFQDVFIRLIRNRKRYRETARFTTWLYAITRSACIDAMRKAKTQANLIQPTDGDTVISLAACAGSTPRDAAHESFMRERILHAVHSLPDEQREALMLRENTDMTFDEIGALLGCPANTVKSRLHYALSAVRRRLIQDGITP